MTGTGRWGGRAGTHARQNHDVNELQENSFAIVQPDDGYSRMCQALQAFFKSGGKSNKDEKED
jgi:hypothetical protein